MVMLVAILLLLLLLSLDGAEFDVRELYGLRRVLSSDWGWSVEVDPLRSVHGAVAA